MWVSRRRQSCCSSYCSNDLSPAHHRRQKAQSRKKAQCCRFGCFRLVFSSSRRLRSFVPWEQGWGWVWQQWRMSRPPRELGKRHNSRTLSLWCRSCPSEVAPEFVRIILFHDKSVKIKDYELVRLSCKSKVNSMPRVTRVVASHWTKGCIFNFALNSTQLRQDKIKFWFFLSAYSRSSGLHDCHMRVIHQIFCLFHWI